MPHPVSIEVVRRGAFVPGAGAEDVVEGVAECDRDVGGVVEVLAQALMVDGGLDFRRRARPHNFIGRTTIGMFRKSSRRSMVRAASLCS